jgi:hypothetical protein
LDIPGKRGIIGKKFGGRLAGKLHERISFPQVFSVIFFVALPLFSRPGTWHKKDMTDNFGGGHFG